VGERMAQVVEELFRRFPTVPRATIERRVLDALARYAEAPVQGFVPVLVQREIAALLEHMVRLPPRSESTG